MAVHVEDLAVSRGLDEASLWHALSDSTRRRILDLLRDRPRTTGDIASSFEISRIAVMRHLEVLSAAGLVTNRKRGRERWHYLNAVPLERMYERWVEARAGQWAAGLLRFRHGVESKPARMSSNQPAVDVALEVTIAAPRADVFAALTRDPGGWWGRPYLRPESTGLSLEPRLGGLFIETWEGGGAVVATVTGWTDDRYVELAGTFHMGAALGFATFDLSDHDGGTVVQFSFRAIGAIDAGYRDRAPAGWGDLIRRLKTLLETHARLGIAPDPPNEEVSHG